MNKEPKNLAGSRVIIISGEFAGPNHLMLSWLSASTEFQLQQNSTLLVNEWSAVTNATVTTNGQNEVAVVATNRQAFYRLIYQ